MTDSPAIGGRITGQTQQEVGISRGRIPRRHDAPRIAIPVFHQGLRVAAVIKISRRPTIRGRRTAHTKQRIVLRRSSIRRRDDRPNPWCCGRLVYQSTISLCRRTGWRRGNTPHCQEHADRAKRETKQDAPIKETESKKHSTKHFVNNSPRGCISGLFSGQCCSGLRLHERHVDGVDEAVDVHVFAEIGSRDRIA